MIEDRGLRHIDEDRAKTIDEYVENQPSDFYPHTDGMTQDDILYLLHSAKNKRKMIANDYLINEIKASMLYAKNLQIPFTVPVWLPDEKHWIIDQIKKEL